MSVGKKIAVILSFVAIAIVGVVGYMYYPAISGTITGNKYYSSIDIQNSYDLGFGDGFKTETELKDRLTYYTKMVDDYEFEIKALNSELSKLQLSNADYERQIEALNNTIRTNETSISELQTLVNSNNELIASLQDDILNYKLQISMLEVEIDKLEEDLTNNAQLIMNKDNQITALNNQVESLQTLVTQLNRTNNLNLQTIETLNKQIASLNSQITDLKLQINNNSSNLSGLNDRIAELEKSVKYYEQYIASLESDTQVVVTFEFNNSVYNIQVLQIGSFASVTNPESTDYIIFNGWKYNDEIVDISTFAVRQNTKFVADITYKYAVNFEVDNVNYNSQIVEKGMYATIPTPPVKDGYEFDGWTIDGKTIVSVNEQVIFDDITFVAMFTKLHNVTFMYEDIQVDNQVVRNGATIENVEIESTNYKIFKGWLVNGTSVNLTNYKIVADTVFVADILYKYDVVFNVDGVVYNSQIVENNKYITAPTIPLKDGYVFAGWSIDGISAVNISTIRVTSNISFVALFNLLPTATFVVDGEVFDSYITDTSYMLATPNDPSMQTGTFYYWTTDGENMVDFSTFTMMEDTTFTAVSTNGGLFDYDTGEIIYSWKYLIDNNIIKVTVNGSLVQAGTNENLLTGHLIIDNGGKVKTVGGFDNNTALKGVTIPASCTSLWRSAFADCSALRKVIIEDNSQLTYITEYAFRSSEAITEFSFGANSKVEVLQHESFYHCEALRSIVIPASVRVVGEDCFLWADSLSSITFESGSQLETIETAGFLATGISTITLPKTLKTIGNRAFYNCKSLTQVLYEDGIAYESIGEEAFGYCKISIFYIPESCTTIAGADDDTDAFRNCYVSKVGLTIYCGAKAKQSGWGEYWNVIDYSGARASVNYGYTYEQFKTAVGW